VTVNSVRLTWRDGAATMLVGAATVVYICNLLSVQVPLISDRGDVAAAGLVLGFVACIVDDWTIKHTALVRTLSVLSVSALGIGIAAMAAESEILLAVFVGMLVMLWVLSTMAHAGVIPTRSQSDRLRGPGSLPRVHP
jgi:hypothetical protein